MIGPGNDPRLRRKTNCNPKAYARWLSGTDLNHKNSQLFQVNSSEDIFPSIHITSSFPPSFYPFLSSSSFLVLKRKRNTGPYFNLHFSVSPDNNRLPSFVYDMNAYVTNSQEAGRCEWPLTSHQCDRVRVPTGFASYVSRVAFRFSSVLQVFFSGRVIRFSSLLKN